MIIKQNQNHISSHSAHVISPIHVYTTLIGIQGHLKQNVFPSVPVKQTKLTKKDLITAMFTREISPHPYKYKHGFVRPILAIGAPVLWKSQMIYKTTITLCTYVCVCMRKLNNDLKPLRYPGAKMT